MEKRQDQERQAKELPQLPPMKISAERLQEIRLKMEGYKEQEKLVRELLEKALANIKEAMSSDLWYMTREYQLGKLDVAKALIRSAVEELGGSDGPDK